MEVFNEYSSELESLNKELQALLTNLQNAHSPNDTKKIDALFSQSEDLTKQMDIEARSLDANSRKTCAAKLTELKGLMSTSKANYKAELGKLNKQGLFAGAEQKSDFQDTSSKYII